MQGSWSLFTKSYGSVIPGFNIFVHQTIDAFKTWRTIYRRGRRYGPEDYVDQAEVYSPDYWKRGVSQEKNVWVDMRLNEEVSREELSRLIRYKLDAWRIAHICAAPFLIGGYALPLALFWLSNYTWMPFSFCQTKETKKIWYEAQDLYRYRSIPSFLADTKWFFDFHAFPFNPVHERAWEELFEKNNVHRDPKVVRLAGDMYDKFIRFDMIRRKSLRHLARSMNFPTFPMLTRMCGMTRIRDYWNLIWNEDYMVISRGLHKTMSHEALYEFAWRRFLAPYDKNLSQEQLMERVEDYFAFLGPDFMKKGQTPNIIILSSYVFGYYNDPAYLVEDISELERNDFEYMSGFAKDAFMRRLEFENGPLRDQVEVHTQKILAERASAKESKTKEVEA
ncbi:unnamed protein product [Phytomonas sp. Hart1]|nr:unnamed protein product [Phytomonas sp. Hart1]|eukprot:CCW70376.1 unnamed protein product [Phytomonas sp. isolate Hart1]